MGALDRFLEKLPDTFDLTTLFDSGVEVIESTIYPNSTVYKYFPAERRSFFIKPQLRFSPREALNDPFEMTRRWREVRAEGFRRYVQERLESTIPAAMQNKSLLLEMLVEEFSEHGQVMTDAQRGAAEKILESIAGREFLKKQTVLAQTMFPLVVDGVFSQLEGRLDEIAENLVSAMGVLSLTEDPFNHQMWAHYADQGRGFVVGLNSGNAFFKHFDGVSSRHLLKKVIYTDEHTESFWKNPYYLFLVKSSGWAYEKEWRMLKKFADCDDSILTSKPNIHLWNLPPDSVKTIHFGHRYDQGNLAADMKDLLEAGASPEFYRVAVNRAAGSLDEQRIN